MIKLSNLVMMAGIVMCMFPFDNWFFVGARLVWGLGAGAFTVFVPKFITETSPTEMSGFLGGSSQTACTLGILVPSLLALAMPDVSEDKLSDFYTHDYWRYAWAVSIAIGFIQLILIQSFFNYETPQTLKENSEWDRLTSLMRRLYKPEAVQGRVLQIQVKNEGEEQGGPSMWESFTDDAYRRATWMGVLMMVFQQLSGINVLIFYSSNIFSNLDKSGPRGAAAINFANMLGALGGMILLTKMGRKISLVIWSFFMGASMIAMGIVFNQSANCADLANDCLPATLELYFCVAFVIFFELGMGVIPWLYMAEIMTNSAMSAGVVTNQVFTLLISSLANTLIKTMDGYVFIMFGAISMLVRHYLVLNYILIGRCVLFGIHERDQRTDSSLAQAPLPQGHNRCRLRSPHIRRGLRNKRDIF